MICAADEEDKKIWNESLSEEDTRFQEDVRRLNELLQNPHPGLSLWHMFRVEVARKVYEYLKEKLHQIKKESK